MDFCLKDRQTILFFKLTLYSHKNFIKIRITQGELAESG